MTDYKKQITLLKRLNAEFETFESADDCLVIQDFTSAFSFTEFIYTKKGKLIEKHDIDCFPLP